MSQISNRMRTSQASCKVSLFLQLPFSQCIQLLSCSHFSLRSFHVLHNHLSSLSHLFKLYSRWSKGWLCKAMFKCISYRCCSNLRFLQCRRFIKPTSSSSSKSNILYHQGMLNRSSNKMLECRYTSFSSLQRPFRYLAIAIFFSFLRFRPCIIYFIIRDRQIWLALFLILSFYYSDMAVFIERPRQTLPAFGAAPKINADASGCFA